MADTKAIKFFTKGLIFTSAIILLVITIISFFVITIDIRVIAQRIGFFIFSVKIILCEIPYEKALQNFPYMRNNLGKGLFILFCGSLLIDGTLDLTTIIGIVMIVLSLILITISFFEK